MLIRDKITVLGSSGMAGHIMTAMLREDDSFAVTDIGPRKKPFTYSLLCDLRDTRALHDLILRSAPSVLINCVGLLVKASEENKQDAIWLNSYLPYALSGICRDHDIKLIHLGTDCVFSGLAGPYHEDAIRDGDDFYSKTKALGEVTGGRDLTIRTSIIGPELHGDGTGLFHWLTRQRTPIHGYTNTFWSGVTTIELARFIRHVIMNNQSLAGLIHFSVPEGISKYDLLILLRDILNIKLDINPVAVPIIDKRLVCTRHDLGMVPKSYSNQVQEMLLFMRKYSALYQHYREIL